MRRTRAWPGREAWNEEDHKGLSWAGSPARGQKAQQQQPPLLLLFFNSINGDKGRRRRVTAPLLVAGRRAATF